MMSDLPIISMHNQFACFFLLIGYNVFHGYDHLFMAKPFLGLFGLFLCFQQALGDFDITGFLFSFQLQSPDYQSLARQGTAHAVPPCNRL